MMITQATSGVAAAALTAVLSLLLQRALADDVAILGDVGLDGRVGWGGEERNPKGIMELARHNRIRRLLVAADAYPHLEAVQQARPGTYKGVEVVPVEGMRDVVGQLWGQEMQP